ncbi:MAG: CynX/NimT family MFS transporter [Halobacteriaceae archaeon]
MSPRTVRWGLLAMGALAYACLLFVWFSVAAFLAPISAELGLSSSEAGLLTGIIPLAYVPVSLFSGAVTDRIGPYRAIGGGLALFGAAQAARAGVTTFPAMLALTVVVGVGGTAITFGLPKLVARLFPAGSAGTPSTVYVLGSLAGTAAAFSLGRGVLGPMLGGWRPVFWTTGLAVLGYAAVWAVAAWLAPTAALRVGEAADESLSLASLRTDVAAVFGSRSMRLLLVVGATYLLVVHGLQNWLTAVLTHRGVAAGVASTVASGFVAARAVGILVVPPLSDRLGRRGGAVAACSAACALGTGALVVGGLPFAVAVAGVTLAGVGVGGLSPLVRIVPPELDDVGPELTGTAVGLIFAVGEFGGFLGPFLVGGLFDLTGSYAPGLAVISAGCVAAIVAGRRLPV